MIAANHVMVAHPRSGQLILARSESAFWLDMWNPKHGVGRMIEWKPLTRAQFQEFSDMKPTKAQWRIIWDRL